MHVKVALSPSTRIQVDNIVRCSHRQSLNPHGLINDPSSALSFKCSHVGVATHNRVLTLDRGSRSNRRPQDWWFTLFKKVPLVLQTVHQIAKVPNVEVLKQ